MDRQFVAQEWTRLPNAERIKHCQSMAEEALKLSKTTASLALAETYLHLAEGWLKLASELAATGHPGSGVPDRL